MGGRSIRGRTKSNSSGSSRQVYTSVEDGRSHSPAIAVKPAYRQDTPTSEPTTQQAWSHYRISRLKPAVESRELSSSWALKFDVSPVGRFSRNSRVKSGAATDGSVVAAGGGG